MKRVSCPLKTVALVGLWLVMLARGDVVEIGLDAARESAARGNADRSQAAQRLLNGDLDIREDRFGMGQHQFVRYYAGGRLLYGSRIYFQELDRSDPKNPKWKVPLFEIPREWVKSVIHEIDAQNDFRRLITGLSLPPRPPPNISRDELMRQLFDPYDALGLRSPEEDIVIDAANHDEIGALPFQLRGLGPSRTEQAKMQSGSESYRRWSRALQDPLHPLSPEWNGGQVFRELVGALARYRRWYRDDPAFHTYCASPEGDRERQGNLWTSPENDIRYLLTLICSFSQVDAPEVPLKIRNETPRTVAATKLRFHLFGIDAQAAATSAVIVGTPGNLQLTWDITVEEGLRAMRTAVSEIKDERLHKEYAFR